MYRILPAVELGKYIREHWWIENKVHHVRERSFKEDDCVKRENPFVFASQFQNTSATPLIY